MFVDFILGPGQPCWITSSFRADKSFFGWFISSSINFKLPSIWIVFFPWIYLTLYLFFFFYYRGWSRPGYLFYSTCVQFTWTRLTLQASTFIITHRTFAFTSNSWPVFFLSILDIFRSSKFHKLVSTIVPLILSLFVELATLSFRIGGDLVGAA